MCPQWKTVLRIKWQIIYDVQQNVRSLCRCKTTNRCSNMPAIRAKWTEPNQTLSLSHTQNQCVSRRADCRRRNSISNSYRCWTNKPKRNKSDHRKTEIEYWPKGNTHWIANELHKRHQQCVHRTHIHTTGAFVAVICTNEWMNDCTKDVRMLAVSFVRRHNLVFIYIWPWSWLKRCFGFFAFEMLSVPLFSERWVCIRLCVCVNMFVTVVLFAKSCISRSFWWHSVFCSVWIMFEIQSKPHNKMAKAKSA